MFKYKFDNGFCDFTTYLNQEIKDDIITKAKKEFGDLVELIEIKEIKENQTDIHCDSCGS